MEWVFGWFAGSIGGLVTARRRLGVFFSSKIRIGWVWIKATTVRLYLLGGRFCSGWKVNFAVDGIVRWNFSS